MLEERTYRLLGEFRKFPRRRDRDDRHRMGRVLKEEELPLVERFMELGYLHSGGFTTENGDMQITTSITPFSEMIYLEERQTRRMNSNPLWAFLYTLKDM